VNILHIKQFSRYNPICSVCKVGDGEPSRTVSPSTHAVVRYRRECLSHSYYITLGGTMMQLSTGLLRTWRFLSMAKARGLRARES
jgi:hypothetical protein